MRPAARMTRMPERRTLTDADGTVIATFTDVERDGRRVADLLELEVPVERALAPILAQLQGFRVAGPVELGRALIDAGGTPARHAHVYSHDLLDAPGAAPAGRDHAHARSTAPRPRSCPPTWPRTRRTIRTTR